MKSWLDPQPLTISDDLRDAIGGHPVVAERLVRRGFTTPADARRFLDPAAYSPAAPDDLPDLDRAVSRLQRAIRQREPILVWGDFDVDGQTSTALLVSALRDLGAVVTYH
ncbi:MAG: single-stranded-DNA-specific exonuclease RecJ, partial [Anaerolineae bacterium]|nr:single-stranded-DNA-specific exonuclease RecJ [Anaerolineae bacterium]